MLEFLLSWKKISGYFQPIRLALKFEFKFVGSGNVSINIQRVKIKNILTMYQKKPSENEQMMEKCNEYEKLSSRHNMMKMNERQELRHHNCKNRHPPTKKEYLKNISHKGKPAKKTNNIFMKHQETTSIIGQLNPSSKPIKNNPIAYMSNDKTIVNVPYHEVSHSQRLKLTIPDLHSQQNQHQEMKNLPLTDRDGKTNEHNALRCFITNMEKKRPACKLDEEFVKCFGNPENMNFMEEKKEGNPFKLRQVKEI